MNLNEHPDLLDRLAAAYALGTLRGGARRRFETLARQHPAVRAAALLWQERFASMTELALAEAPGPNVWKRIENLLPRAVPAAVAAVAQDGALAGALRRALGLWRGAALAGALAAVAAVSVGLNLRTQLQDRDGQLAQVSQEKAELGRRNTELSARLEAAPQIQYVAVLADDKASASMLVTFDPRRGTLTLKRVGDYREASDKSLQLWALPPGGPRSLGVLGGEPVVKLTAAEGEVKAVPALAISLEPKGGAPAGSGPTGPVLFKGALLQTPV